MIATRIAAWWRGLLREVDGVALRRGRITYPAWWLFPRKEVDRDCWLTILSPRWWPQAWWDYVAGPVFRVLVGIGAWEVREEGGYYVAGRFNWRVWRAGRRYGA